MYKGRGRIRRNDKGEVDVDDHVSAGRGPCRAGDLHTFVKRAAEFSPSNSIPCEAK